CRARRAPGAPRAGRRAGEGRRAGPRPTVRGGAAARLPAVPRHGAARRRARLPARLRRVHHPLALDRLLRLLYLAAQAVRVHGLGAAHRRLRPALDGGGAGGRRERAARAARRPRRAGRRAAPPLCGPRARRAAGRAGPCGCAGLHLGGPRPAHSRVHPGAHRRCAVNIIDRLRALFERGRASRIIRDTSAMTFASWASTGLSFLTSFVLAAILGDAGFGLISIGIALVSTITQFLDIRTSESLIRFVGNALARGEKREAITYFYVALTADVILMLATLAAVLLLGPESAVVYGEDADTVRRLLGIYALTIPFSTLEGTFEPMLTVMRRFTYLSAGRVFNSVVLMASLIVGAQFGLEGVMWGYVAASAVSFLTWTIGALVEMVRTFDTARGEGYLAAWRQFLPFSLHTSV